MLIETKEENRVYWIVLNRPEKANAISREMWPAMAAAMREGDSSQETRVVAITGAGKYFSAGQDMAELNATSSFSEAFDLFIGTMKPVFEGILRCSKPVIAALNGPAIGAGAELVFACDMAVAQPDVYLALSQGRYGVGPPLGLNFGAPILGRKRLSEMALTGRRIDAAEAERWGLVNAIAKKELKQEIEEIAKMVSEVPPVLVREIKEVTLRQMSDAGYEEAFNRLAMFSQSKETKEGTSGFLSRK